MAYDPELADRALAALAAHPALDAGDIIEKAMFGGVAYLVRGAMAVGVLGERLVVRATPDDAARWTAEPHVRPMDFTGRPMKGWLYVDAPAVATEAAMRTWVERSVGFVLANPAKPKKTAPVKNPTKSPSPRKRGR